MITIKEHINNLVKSNSKHIVKLNNEEEVKQWLNSLLWSVAGFKQAINEEELDELAEDYTNHAEMTGWGPRGSSSTWGWYDIEDAFKAGYYKAKEL